jgi:hypothetical protein
MQQEVSKTTKKEQELENIKLAGIGSKFTLDGK